MRRPASWAGPRAVLPAEADESAHRRQGGTWRTAKDGNGDSGMVAGTGDRGKQSALLEDALDYAGRGWSIIPVIDQRAAGPWTRFQVRPADEPTLRHLFGRRAVNGLAAIMGAASGMLGCRDFDTVTAYRLWAG